VKPFIKWAGGKSQLLKEIAKQYPTGLGTRFTKYAEPFVGGGAVLFDLLNKYEFESILINDINRELVNTYTAIRDDLIGLISQLQTLQDEYLFGDREQRKDYYYGKRDRFNELKVLDVLGEHSVECAALFIFLNRTCFNGLYRVNSKGQFNVPLGAYKNPLICDEDNLTAISEKLENVIISHGDFKKSGSFIDSATFAYFDPPYRPLTATANFTAYTGGGFDDAAQKELARFVDEQSAKGAKVIVSNSDPKNSNENDTFFDVLYSKHKISRVKANRMINSDGKGRGLIDELLIANF
jgi:DNA adenine methylase